MRVNKTDFASAREKVLYRKNENTVSNNILLSNLSANLTGLPFAY